MLVFSIDDAIVLFEITLASDALEILLAFDGEVVSIFIASPSVSVKSANEVIVNLGVGVTFGFSQSEDPVFSGDAAVEIIAPEIDEGDEDFGFKDVEHFDEGVVVGEGPGYF